MAPSKMARLNVIKPHRYGTRQLVAGEEYEAPARHAVAMVAARKAQFVSRPAVSKQPKPAPSPPVVEASGAKSPDPEPRHVEHSVGAMTMGLGQADDTDARLDQLRLQATQLGINVDGRWGVARLQHEIAQARK